VDLANPLAFSDPYSGHEVLLLDDPVVEGVLGIIYHPQITAAPIPWRSCCPHCLAGKQRGLDLHLKREVQLLCTHRKNEDLVEYKVPSNSQPYSLVCKADESGWCVKVVRPDTEHVLDVIHRPKEKTVFSGKPREFQSSILHRCLKFLFTARRPSRSEITSCLMALVKQQRRDGIPVRRYPCGRIDWSLVVGEKH